MIKLMHFIHGFNTGGAETLVKNYMSHIDRSIFDVTILCIEHHPESPYEDDLKKQGINIIYLCDRMKHFGSTNIFYRIKNHYQLYLEIKKAIKEINPDIIHSHLALQHYIHFAHPRKNTVIFHTQHFEFARLLDDRKQIRQMKWILSHYPTQIIALHEQMKKEMISSLHTQYVEVINNGIDLESYHNLFSIKEKRKELGIKEDALLIIHVGRFDEVKNHDFLLDVFYEIKKKREKAELLLIGSGPEEENILNKIKHYNMEDYVHIISNRNDVNECLQCADGAIFPSFSEGMPLSLIEMQAASLPIVVSNTISKETQVSNLMSFLDLEDPCLWANTLINKIEEKEEVIYDHLEEWDIRESVRELEQLYIKRLNTWNQE